CHLSSSESDSSESMNYESPNIEDLNYDFIELFDDSKLMEERQWIKSEEVRSKSGENNEKYEGEWKIEECLSQSLIGNKGLVLKSKAKHHAIAKNLKKPFEFHKEKPFILSYQVKFQNSLECGGAYIKLVSLDEQINSWNGKLLKESTPYSIMFGPDKCGNQIMLHFIIRYKNKKTGEIEEKHGKHPEKIESFFTDGRTHVYTLIIKSDGKYEIRIDNIVYSSGNIVDDLTPSLLPSKLISDPNEKKPDDWDDREMIDDDEAEKPDDWDETESEQIQDVTAIKPDGWLEDENKFIPDPQSKQPEDWDSQIDGEWEPKLIENSKCSIGCGEWTAPMIKNPKYRGKWIRPKKKNPDYKGIWSPKMIENPQWYHEEHPNVLTPFIAVALELWSITTDSFFDNFFIGNDLNSLDKFIERTWFLINKEETRGIPSADSVVDAIVKATQDKPWLWILYIAVVLVPIIVILVFCFRKSDESHKIEKKIQQTKETVVEELIEEKNEIEKEEQEEIEEFSDEEMNENDEDEISKGDSLPTIPPTEDNTESTKVEKEEVEEPTPNPIVTRRRPRKE
ncbi:hypothetical protein SNEBB_006229, partial [Seison nebaliae]